MVAVWLAATAVEGTGGWRVAQAPYRAWLAMWHLGAAGSVPAAAAVIAPAAIPLGLAAGGLAWSYRIRSMETGAGGLSPDAAVSFDLRRWRHQVRSAQARIAAPGSLPLTMRDGWLVTGAVIRTVGHPARQIALIPYPRMRSHQVVIGTTGTGNPIPRLALGDVGSAAGDHLDQAIPGKHPDGRRSVGTPARKRPRTVLPHRYPGPAPGPLASETGGRGRRGGHSGHCS
jgi:hypothetical protein